MKPWQIKLYAASLMKKEKVKLISKLADFSDKRIFDLGCSNGTVSHFLKQNGGRWVHADLDRENLVTSRELLGETLFQVGEGSLPLKERQFDLVVALDVLEHLTDDVKMVDEIRRVLKPQGLVIISTPISGGFFLLNWLKGKLGLTPEIYGHKREGYSLKQLQNLLEENGFNVIHASTYAKFLVELLEILLNVAYTRVNRIKGSRLRSGAISPSSAFDLNKNSKLFSIYARFIYPLVYLFTRIDKLLWFKTGYATLVVAQRMEIQ